MFLIFLIPIIYILYSLFNFTKIGIGWDTSVNMVKGEQVYRFLQTLDFSYLNSSGFKSLYFNEIPDLLNGHPTAFSFVSFLVGNFFSAFFGFRFYFFHIADFVLAIIFLVYFGLFIFKITKSFFVSLLLQLMLVAHPFFYLHSIVNTKDFPVAVFSFIAFYYVYFSEHNKKKRQFNFILSFIFFTLAFYSKFTVLFLIPFYIYLVKRFAPKINLYTSVILISLFSAITLFFYPMIIFKFSDEFIRILNVYLYLPSRADNSASFLYFVFINTPLFIFCAYFSVFFSALFTKKYRNEFLFWVLPSLLYLTFINKQYDALRQFMFLFIPFTLYAFVLINTIAKYMSNTAKSLFFLISFTYLMYLLLLPIEKKIFFKNVLNNEPVHDGWGISLPLALDYINKKYPSGRLYYSPGNFLLEYYRIRKYEIIYQPEYSDIWIAARKTSSYVEEKDLREKNYKKDPNFSVSSGMLEIWVKKDKVTN